MAESTDSEFSFSAEDAQALFPVVADKKPPSRKGKLKIPSELGKYIALSQFFAPKISDLKNSNSDSVFAKKTSFSKLHIMESNKAPTNLNCQPIKKELDPIGEFCHQNHVSASPIDVINAARKEGKYSEEELDNCTKDLDYHIQKSLPRFYQYVANGLANGKGDQETSQSYRKKWYPLGLPKCSGCTPEMASYLNNNWYGEEQRTSNDEKPKIIQQLTQKLECVEDSHSEIDVMLNANANIRHNILEYGFGNIGMSSIYNDESIYCFGNAGPLALKLAVMIPSVSEFVSTLFHQRAVILHRQRLIKKPSYCHDLELLLPGTRAQFQKSLKLNDWDNYMMVNSPIVYDVKNVAYIPEIFDRYIIARQGSNRTAPKKREVRAWREIIAQICAYLRENEGQHLMGYGMTSVLTAFAVLARTLSSVRELSNRADESRKIALEIGITTPAMHGAERVFDTAIDAIVSKVRKPKDSIIDIAGLFKKADISVSEEIIKSIILASKAMKYLASEPNVQREAPIVKAEINNGTISMTSTWDETPIAVSLERFKPKEKIV